MLIEEIVIQNVPFQIQEIAVHKKIIRDYQVSLVIEEK